MSWVENCPSILAAGWFSVWLPVFVIAIILLIVIFVILRRKGY